MWPASGFAQTPENPLDLADSLQPATLPSLPSGVSVNDSRLGDALFHDRGGCFVCGGAEAQGVSGAANALTLGVSHVEWNLDLIDSVITNGILADPWWVAAVAAMASGGGAVAWLWPHVE